MFKLLKHIVVTGKLKYHVLKVGFANKLMYAKEINTIIGQTSRYNVIKIKV